MTTTPATQSPRSCPPSAVVDMIVPWTDSDGTLNVGAGDLIVHAGRFDTVTRVEVGLLPNGDDCVHVSVAGSWLPCCFPADSLVAVRRYDTLASTPDDPSGASTSSRGGWHSFTVTRAEELAWRRGGRTS